MDGTGRGDERSRALRRFREAVCFVCAVALWLLAWSLERGGFAAPHGRPALLSIGAAEIAFLALVFWREQSTVRETATPWITVAWASLPAWFALQLLVGSALHPA